MRPKVRKSQGSPMEVFFVVTQQQAGICAAAKMWCLAFAHAKLWCIMALVPLKISCYKKHVQNSRALEMFYYYVLWVKRATTLPFEGVELCPQILKNFHESGEHLGILLLPWLRQTMKNHARILCVILFANRRIFVVSRSEQPTCFFATLLQVLDIVQDKDLSHGRIREQKHPTCTIYASTPSKLPSAIFVLFVFGRFAAPDHVKHERG